MRVFIYEFVTGGGFLGAAASAISPGLLAQGQAMLQALAEDFTPLRHVQVLTQRDFRLPSVPLAGVECHEVHCVEEEQRAFQRLTVAADWTIVIAPETDNHLLTRSRGVEHSGGRLLSPPPECVAIASNKSATCDLLSRRGVPVPQGYSVHPMQDYQAGRIAFPAVLKPNDGCGSEGIRILHQPADLPSGSPPGWRIEEFVRGLPVSVAVLCGPKSAVPLPACEQVLSGDGRFEYLGGRLPVPRQLSARAQSLALRAVGALPSPRGYIGVDLVLGGAADGSDDRVIEINPRLTTSYVGLRRASRTNLAEAMLAIASGQSADLAFADASLEFTAEGTCIEKLSVPPNT